MSQSDPIEQPPVKASSEYGILNPDACDPDLRARVIAAIAVKDREPPTMTTEQMTEIATYITQLEDALLRHHWGALNEHQIFEILKCSTGLDIEMRAQELAAMAAVDA